VIRDQFFVPSMPPMKPIEHTPRTTTDHYVVIEAVDEQERPVRGVRIEVLIPDGEIRGAQTGQDGIARVERIQAASVVIRVLDLDGSMWKALDGAPSQLSSEEPGFGWHEVKRGECLSRIAHHYGLKSWKTLWQHPKNEPLRAKRKSPHVLWPGDQVAVPRVEVYEMVRATDGTHRIRIKAGAMREVRLRVQDFGSRALGGLTYTLRYEHGGSTVERPGRSATGSDGMLSEELPIEVERVQLLFDRPRITIALRVGHLDPSYTDGEPVATGIQARLSGLGYASHGTPGVFRDAIAAFQRNHMDREENFGELDSATFSKLQELYGV